MGRVAKSLMCPFGCRKFAFVSLGLRWLQLLAVAWHMKFGLWCFQSSRKDTATLGLTAFTRALRCCPLHAFDVFWFYYMVASCLCSDVFMAMLAASSPGKTNAVGWRCSGESQLVPTDVDCFLMHFVCQLAITCFLHSMARQKSILAWNRC